MSNIFSREQFSCRHFSDSSKCQNIDLEAKYEDCTYKISIPLTLEDEFWPKFSSLTIHTVYQGNSKGAIVTHADYPLQHPKSCYDRRGIGEFIFLLAAKFKRDLLHKVEEDNAGFLHTTEIIELKKNVRTNVGKQIYRSISQVSSGFLLKILFAEIQLYHLLGYQGKTSGDTDLVWWLNVSPENIEFKNNNKIIPNTILKKYLDKLLPQACLLTNSRKKEFYAEHILEESGDITNRAIEKRPVIIHPTDHRIKEFKTKLKSQAKSHLKEKLHGNKLDDYSPLGIELGLLKESGDLKSAPEDHNREWQAFSHKELENPQCVYILSSETGSGKTTFLRNLQLEIIEKTELIPIFLEASNIENLDFMKWDIDSFLLSVGKLICRTSSNIKDDFLITQKDKIVFLIDGLDQITGSDSEYRNLIDKLTGVIEDKLIITSRPFAVTDKEKDSKIKFLRLKPFSEKETERYFAEKYECAKEICKTCPEMIHTPMLAYMVRQLIEEGRDDHIKNRTDLYKEFIDYIFEDYSHDNLRKISRDKRARIREAYGEMSFKAIANDTSYLQKIPFLLAVKYKETAIEIDDLFKYGIAHLIVNRSQGDNENEYVYFSHQSFQEYLAAEYISENETLIQQVLAEKWNPKWKGVIKFLVGFRGQEIIQKILSEKDNSIHSKLFLSAELVPETRVSPTLRKRICQRIEELFDCPPFGENAERYWVYTCGTNAINKLIDKLGDEDKAVVRSAIYALVELKDKRNIDSKVVKKIVDKLEDEDKEVVKSAISALGKLKDRVGIEVIEKIVGKLEDEDKRVVESAIDALGELKDRVGIEVIEKIVGKLEDRNKRVVESAIYTLAKLKDRVGIEVIEKIVGKLEDEFEDKRVVRSAIYTLAKLKDRVGIEVIEKIVDKLEDEDKWVVRSAIIALGKLKDRVGIEVIEKIVGKLEDEYKRIVESAIYTLAKLKDRVGIEVIEKIVDKLEDEDKRVVESAIDALGELKDRVGIEVIEKIVGKLEDEDKWVVRSAISTLGELKDRVGIEVIEKIVGKLEDEDKWVVRSAINALGDLKDRVDIEVIEKIVGKLEDEDEGVVISAISTLGKLKDRVGIEVIEKIVDKLEDEDKGVVRSAISTLGKLKDRVGIEVIEKIVDKLKDEDEVVGYLAIDALGKLKDRVDDTIVKRLIASKSTKAYIVLSILYQDGRLEFLE